MKKIIIILLTILLLVGILLIMIYTNVGAPNLYAYSVALCDENNYCEDYFIECEGSNMQRLTPTGFAIQHTENFSTPNKSDVEFCKK